MLSALVLAFVLVTVSAGVAPGDEEAALCKDLRAQGAACSNTSLLHQHEGAGTIGTFSLPALELCGTTWTMMTIMI